MSAPSEHGQIMCTVGQDRVFPLCFVSVRMVQVGIKHPREPKGTRRKECATCGALRCNAHAVLQGEWTEEKRGRWMVTTILWHPNVPLPTATTGSDHQQPKKRGGRKEEKCERNKTTADDDDDGTESAGAIYYSAPRSRDPKLRN